MTCTVTEYNRAWFLFAVYKALFFFKCQIKPQFHSKIINMGDRFPSQVYKAGLKSYVYFNMEEKHLFN